MIVLSLDPSLTRTGYAVFSAPPPRLNDLLTGSFGSADPDNFVSRVLALIDKHGIEFLFSEQARAVILQYGRKQLIDTGGFAAPNGNQLKLTEIQGGMRGLCAARGIPLAFVAPQTWRAKVLGNGHLSRAEAKAAAKTYCARLGVPAANHDVAEAVCIGLWGCTCNADFRLKAHEQSIRREA